MRKRLVAGVLLGPAVAWLAGDLEARNAPRGLRPVHEVHARQGLACEDCHPAAGASSDGRDLLLPAEDDCAQCHDVADAAGCGLCHTRPQEPRGYGARAAVAQNFPHEVHVRGGMECAACHLEEGAAEPVLPSKASCRTCHATASQQSDCRVCHASGEELRPASHGPQFRELHALQAAWNQKSCAMCHTETDCQECHNGDNVRPRSHPLNYFYEHALDARTREVTCASCHRSDFCSACHAAGRILPAGHASADWLLPSGGRHAEEGRFDMESCAACHAEGAAPSCVPCHGR